jgi:hypothetical protein
MTLRNVPPAVSDQRGQSRPPVPVVDATRYILQAEALFVDSA